MFLKKPHSGWPFSPRHQSRPSSNDSSPILFLYLPLQSVERNSVLAESQELTLRDKMLPSHLCYLVTSILLPAQALLLEDQSFSLSIDSSEAGSQEEMLQRMWSRVIPDFETLWKVLKSFVIVLEFGKSAFWRENIMEDVDRSKLRVRLGSEKCSCIDLTCGQMTTLEKFNWPLHNHRNILDIF